LGFRICDLFRISPACAGRDLGFGVCLEFSLPAQAGVSDLGFLGQVYSSFAPKTTS